jgi:hypothetical protein
MELHWFDFVTLCMFIVFIHGSFKNEPDVFVQINFFIKVFIGFYLIYKFNDFRKVSKITVLDQKICAFAGFYILVFSFADVITIYLDNIRNYIKKILASGD